MSGGSPYAGQNVDWPTRDRRAWTLFLGATLALVLACATQANAQAARISSLSDVAFGTITNLSADVSQSQTVCAYSSAIPARYSITASGSGSGNAFTLSNGAGALAYDVQWNAAAGQTSGTMLAPGVALTGLASTGLTSTCTLGVTPSGSLTITLRAAALSSAPAGSFTGTLTLLIAPN